MIRLAREKLELRVVDERHGAPTLARSIAEATAAILRRPVTASGVCHLSASGKTTWRRFAREIVRLAGLSTPVRRMTTAAYPTPTMRPMNSILDNLRVRGALSVGMQKWHAALKTCMRDL
jgi:dTDP-4-dehydrorhamnose reductase